MYNWSALVNNLFPTFAEALTAVKNADTGGDPRMLLAVLARLPQADTRIAGLMQTRKLAVLGYDWDVVPADDTSRAEEIAGEIKNRMIRAGLNTHFGHILGSVFYGIAGLKINWGNNLTTKETFPTISLIPSTSLIPTSSGVQIIQDEDKLTLSPADPPEQYIIARFNPISDVLPNYIGGILRSCLWLSIMKHFNWQDWGKFNEMFAQPLRWAQWKRGASDEDKTTAKQAASQIGTDAWAAVSEDVELKFIEAVRTGSIQAYSAFLEAVNSEQSILILGQTLTTELPGKTGSRAAAQVHNLVRQDIMWYDIQLLQNTINERYVNVDYRLNFNDPINLRPKFKMIIDEQVNYESNARIVSELKAAGVPLKKEEVYEKTGFDVPQEGDKTI